MSVALAGSGTPNSRPFKTESRDFSDSAPDESVNLYSQSIKNSSSYPSKFTSQELDIFGQSPLSTVYNISHCPYCNRPIIDSRLAEHSVTCQKDMEEKIKKKKSKMQRDSSQLKDTKDNLAGMASSGANTPKSFSINVGQLNSVPQEDSSSSASSNSKKRKSEDMLPSMTGPTKAESTGKSTPKSSTPDASVTGSKKKTMSRSSSSTKTKGPVDIERQCGVLLPNGMLCARSLTCKTHSMGAKRAVPGRSQPYDALLASYQKKNQAKLQKQALHAAQPDIDEPSPSAVDSDEEVSLVLDAVSRTAARPLERKSMIPVRRRHNFFRVREMLAGALGRPGSQPQQVSGIGGILGRVIPFKVPTKNENAQAPGTK